MLYLIYGNDREKGRARFHALQEKLSAQGGSVEVMGEGVTDEVLEKMSATRALFGGATVATFDGVLEKKAEQEIVARHAPLLSKSPNHFLVFEPSLGKEYVDEIARFAEESIDCSIKKTESKPSFNIFSLGDALGERNKKDLWILYQKARTHNIEPEEVCNTLFWSVKNIALMKDRRVGDDAGLNPFVAKKTRTFAKNYTHAEIVGLSRALVSAYHEAHRGGEPMSIALEKFILTL